MTETTPTVSEAARRLFRKPDPIERAAATAVSGAKIKTEWDDSDAFA